MSEANSEPIDHRRLGRALRLFDSYEELGAGLPVWLPNGAAVRAVLEQYVMQLEREAGYRHIYSPVLAKRDLYERSGHWQHYQDDMFPPMNMGNEEVVLRPMLCPHHLIVYRSESRSYRQLPIRIAEIGGQYRNELSGSLGGLSRVRGMALNDGHVFCREDQIEAEMRSSLMLIQQAAIDVGVEIDHYRLSLRDDGAKYEGSSSLWERSQEILRHIVRDLDLPHQEAEGEAAFYGPKIDVQVRDAGRHEVSWSTVQLDFLLPERFDLSYIGEDGAKHRPVMVHRSVVGAMERIVAYLIERWAGAFPFWLAPVQMVVLPVGDGQVDAAEHLSADFVRQGFRCEVDAGSDSLGDRMHRASSQLVPFVCVLGDREVAENTVSIRGRDGNRYDAMSIARLLAGLHRLNNERSHGLHLA